MHSEAFVKPIIISIEGETVRQPQVKKLVRERDAQLTQRGGRRRIAPGDKSHGRAARLRTPPSRRHRKRKRREQHRRPRSRRASRRLSVRAKNRHRRAHRFIFTERPLAREREREIHSVNAPAPLAQISSDEKDGALRILNLKFAGRKAILR